MYGMDVHGNGTAVPVGLNKWITMLIEVSGDTAQLFVNNSQYSTFVVDKMKGETTSGATGPCGWILARKAISRI
jgi:hypothetical protein